MALRLPVSPRYFIDETSLGVAKALAAVRRDVVHPGHFLLPGVPTGTTDPVWMPIVAAMGLVVISRDAGILRRPAELELYRRHGLRGFWITGKTDPPMSDWVYLGRLITQWRRIDDIIDTRGLGPWAYAVYPTKITELALRRPHRRGSLGAA